MAESGELCLGIDCGTTSVKLSLIEKSTKTLVFSTSEVTNAYVPSKIGSLGAEQDVVKIFDAVISCLNRITDEKRSRIKCISVSGQMHGVMLWNSGFTFECKDTSQLPSFVSNLITWEDKRASSQFLATLPEPNSHQPLASGFGLVTLFWLVKNDPEMVVKFDTVGGIMDFFTCMLCGLDKPTLSNQIAASWGYFDCETNTWNTDILQEHNFPVFCLPNVIEAGSRIGDLSYEWFGIPKGTPILAGLDCEGFVPRKPEVPSPVSYFPYFNSTFLAMAASLNGGNNLKAFVKMIQQWFQTFDVVIPEDKIWSKLTELSMVVDIPEYPHNLVIQPHLCGERHAPDLTTSLSGLERSNSSLHSVFQAICKGLVNNLNLMMPVAMLIESGVQRLVLSGSVIHKQPHVTTCVEKIYAPLSVVPGSNDDASFGAALVAAKFLNGE
ncbi:SHPK-like protein [Mya arenaria]|uniref:SHPK-like protein n=1 Tax=Mya arenaria TaxID=6604 RepID=A0ABY7E1C1_MYAAR|nr:SHPK-like protein [Mya arenaria]